MMYKYVFRKKLRIRNKTKKSMLETPTYFLSLFKVWLPFLYGRGDEPFSNATFFDISTFSGNNFKFAEHFCRTFKLKYA